MLWLFFELRMLTAAGDVESGRLFGMLSTGFVQVAIPNFVLASAVRLRDEVALVWHPQKQESQTICTGRV